MDFKKKVWLFTLTILMGLIILQLFMNYINFYNMGFRFCISVFLMFVSVGLYMYSQRGAMKDYLLGYYGGDEKKTEEYYRYQMFFIKIYFLVASIFLLIGIFTLI